MTYPKSYHPEKDIENRAAEQGAFAIAYALLKLADAQEDMAKAMPNLERLNDSMLRIAQALECISETIDRRPSLGISREEEDRSSH